MRRLIIDHQFESKILGELDLEKSLWFICFLKKHLLGHWALRLFLEMVVPLLLRVQNLIEVWRFREPWKREHYLSAGEVESRTLFYSPLKIQNRICLFSHFDQESKVTPHTIRYLAALFDLGFDIAFCSTSQHLDDATVVKLKKFCHLVVVRENVGFDFGSWKTLMNKLGTDYSPEILLLANDSVIGPLRPLDKIVTEFLEGSDEALVLTDCLQHKHHAQSYFLCFKKQVLTHCVWKNFWNDKNFVFFEKKSSVVLWQEVFLGNWILENLKSKIVYPYADLIEMTPRINPFPNIRPLNPTVFYWKCLIHDFGFPFIKKEVLRNALSKDISWKNLEQSEILALLGDFRGSQ